MTMSEVCPECGGTGMVLAADAAGRRVARVCQCQQTAVRDHKIGAARVPKRYQHCSLESYDTDFRGADLSMRAAHLTGHQ